MRKAFNIGENTLNGRQQFMGTDDMSLHWLVVGGTGRGKSKLLELRIRHHLQHRHGLLLLDPHGTLYEDVLAYATAAGFRSRVVLVAYSGESAV